MVNQLPLIRKTIKVTESLVFTLSHEEYISIDISCKRQDLYSFSHVTIIFQRKNERQYTLCDRPIMSGIDIFNLLLKKAIKTQLQLDESIQHDIGICGMNIRIKEILLNGQIRIRLPG